MRKLDQFDVILEFLRWAESKGYWLTEWRDRDNVLEESGKNLEELVDLYQRGKESG